MGADIHARPDGFVVRGPARLKGARLDGRGDHRVGMLGAIAGSLADGETRIENDAVGVSYPRFWQDLAHAAEGRMITA
jgi:3-phosphoshikimate 1-carboxyvinyltransferase